MRGRQVSDKRILHGARAKITMTLDGETIEIKPMTEIFYTCLPPEPIRPWYVRLWRWFFPERIKPFTSITVPMCFYTHPTAESLRETICSKEPK